MPRPLILLYLVGVLSPFIALALGGFGSKQSFFLELGRSFGLIGFMLLAFQVVLAGRFKALTRPFGLDIVIRYHRNMGILAFLFLLAHPLFVALGSGSFNLLYSLNLPIPVLIGKACLILLLANLVITKFQRSLKIKYEGWRVWHDLVAPLILAGAFLHALAVGGDFSRTSLQLLWMAVLAGFLILLVYVRLIRTRLLWRNPYQVTEVIPETSNVWTVKMTPGHEGRSYDYLPGQFHFLTFKSISGPPKEEHHFTISSSPVDSKTVSSTIKALGDFTSRIGDLAPGDQVRIHGPFGRFSHVLNPEAESLVFITGGIGITPLMGMIRHMKDTGSRLPVTLLYANNALDDIVFREELEAIQTGGSPPLKVVHILRNPPENWNGPTGNLTPDMLTSHMDAGLSNQWYYLCGPAGLVRSAAGILMEMGIPDERIHTEIFSFID